MVIGDILLAVLGNGAYEVLSTIIKEKLEITDSNIQKEFIKVYSKSVERFFEIYGGEFGTIDSSFLSFEKNWEKIVKASLYYSATDILPQDLCIDGFGVSRQSTERAVKEFLRILKEEMREVQAFDKIIEEKAHHSDTKHMKEKVDKIEKVLNVFASSFNNDKGDNCKSKLEIRELKKENWSIEKGKLFTMQTGNSTLMKYMIRDDIICIEYIFEDGASAYYDVDFDGNIKNIKWPYPLHEYTIEIPDDLFINEGTFVLPNGFKRIIKNLKWGKHVEIIMDNQNKMVNFVVLGGVYIEHKSRSIRVTPVL